MTPATKKPHWTQATAWMLGAGLLFLLAYGGSNRFSAGLMNVPSRYLPWEESIPFVPWSVVPYWSLDLLFMVSFYGLISHAELRRHGARILFALGVSVVGFLLFPLRFAFERPETAGIPGLLFQALAVDLPYNQLPSLHVSLALIYWPVIRRMLPTRLKFPGAVWFLFIGLSTLTTFQHHAVDLVGGLLVGLLAMHLIPLTPAPIRPVSPSMWNIAGAYLLAAGGLPVLAMLLQGWALALLYPFVSLALVGGAYASGRGHFLHKSDGRHCAVAWLLFAPYLLGQRLNAAWHNRKTGGAHPWSELTPGILIGSRPDDAQARRLIAEQKVGAVLDLSGELPEAAPLRALSYRHLPWHDLVPPTCDQLDEAISWVQAQSGPVYVHCSLGLGRSVAVAVALLKSRGLSPALARRRVAALRSGAILPKPTATEDGCHV